MCKVNWVLLRRRPRFKKAFTSDPQLAILFFYEMRGSPFVFFATMRHFPERKKSTCFSKNGFSMFRVMCDFSGKNPLSKGHSLSFLNAFGSKKAFSEQGSVMHIRGLPIFFLKKLFSFVLFFLQFLP